MDPIDAERCAKLDAQLFAGDSTWSAAAFHSELEQSHTEYIVIRDNQRAVVGYAGIALLGNSFCPESEIHNIGVDPAHQGRGLGSLLLRELLSHADKHGGPVFLDARVDNHSALALYRRHGFDVIGTRTKYYQPSGTDAYTMRRASTTYTAPKGADRAVV
ncbi:ribosomal-protein-alanine N-acetyltransferase [Rhodococcus sp. KBS0724]|uniref:ribosomal protein S18-alanine N-acetyltransferase n=1 Tax=Rhodococcus sp. KBS0724 TaxID=1179674 RepID=UPI00110F225B|nr:ribosomal protein S18-alanine N-acetyltransferase [Rhodococcus sp. KBS0724]TSD40406.1 ribosomal-protein-alanine N-acetyltransferase [Rhodococcus sp. KBS0724]